MRCACATPAHSAATATASSTAARHRRGDRAIDFVMAIVTTPGLEVIIIAGVDFVISFFDQPWTAQGKNLFSLSLFFPQPAPKRLRVSGALCLAVWRSLQRAISVANTSSRGATLI